MPLPELTIASIGWIALVYIGGFVSGEVIPWFFRALLNHRQKRRHWYGNVSSAAGRAGNLFSADTEFDTIDEKTMEELNIIERELSDLVTTDLEPDKEILTDAKELRIHISRLTNSWIMQDMAQDSPVPLPKDIDNKGSEIWKIRETVDELNVISPKLNNNAATKAKSGYSLFGVKI